MKALQSLLSVHAKTDVSKATPFKPCFTLSPKQDKPPHEKVRLKPRSASQAVIKPREHLSKFSKNIKQRRPRKSCFRDFVVFAEKIQIYQEETSVSVFVDPPTTLPPNVTSPSGVDKFLVLVLSVEPWALWLVAWPGGWENLPSRVSGDWSVKE